MKANYLLYFCDSIGSVFDSQVLALINSISNKKYFKEVYLFLGIKDEKDKNNINSKIPPDLKTVFYKTYPNYPFFNFLIRRSIKSALQEQRLNLNEVIFHTRGELTALHLSEILDKKYHKNILPDVRGASVEEIGEFYDSNKFLKSQKITNYIKAVKSLNHFNKISAVSISLKQYLITNYHIASDRISITPCLAGPDFRYDESQREYIRKELNLKSEDSLIVFSTGGTANWQNNDMLILLAEKGFKVLNLSKKEINHKNIINRFVSYSEIPAYLNAADAAIIWRDKSIVNKVASPVKFSEYVCCGLPVIANNTVDMISEYLTEFDCGIIIDSLDSIAPVTLKNLSKKNRKMISGTGIVNFGIETVVESYFKIYSSIINL